MPFTTHSARRLHTYRLVLTFVLLIVLLSFAVIGSSQHTESTQPREPSRQQQPPPDYQISVGAYQFDPLRGEPQLNNNLRITRRPEEPVHYIIQFTKSLTRAERERMKRTYGLRLIEYLPNLAFLEKVNQQTITALAKEPLYRASVLYQPAFKISPRIGEVKLRSPRRQRLAGFLLRAILFNEANPAQVVAAIREAQQSSRSDDDTTPLTAAIPVPSSSPPVVGNQQRRVPGANVQEEYPSNITETKVIDERKLGGQLRVQFMLPSRASLAQIARLEEVRWIEEVPEINYDNGNTAGTIQGGAPGVTPIWNQGIHGEGQILGIIDSIVDLNHCMFQDQADNTVRPAHRKVVGFHNAGGAAGNHGTFVAGIALGDDFNNLGTGANRGMAWAARFTYDTGNATSLLTTFSNAAGDGASIHTNSWHEEPEAYNQTAVDTDTFVWNNEDHLVLGSSGNVGESIGPPGTAKNALCVSATQGSPNQMNFGDGNNGPATGGRRKPEIFAPGCSITSAQVGTNCGIVMDSVVFGFGPICATSWATPATAGAALLVRQYYTDGFYPSGTRQPHHAFTPSGALIKATLLNSTVDMTGIAGYPGNQEGWGLLRLDNTLFFPGSARNLRVWDSRNSDGLNTGDSRTHDLPLASNAQSLKVTLAWSDAPGAVAAATPLVNNLDLTVTSPDGTQTFLGNQFAAGVSTTGGAADNLNNVEMVLINNPAPGTWRITVNGTAVNVGNPGQGYALVATADTPEPPPPVGNQDTLVVRLRFNDIAFEPPLPNLQNKITDSVNYINEVSYGQTTIAPDFYPDVLVTTNPKDFYYHPSRNLLIELTEDMIAQMIAADPNVFTKNPGDPTDDIDRLILVTNDINFNADWATTGSWPYDLPGGFTRPLSVSIQSYDNNAARFNHGLSHQLNLLDLYAHPGVVFPRAYVDEWDNMAGLFTNVHPLVWSKERATWVTSSASQIQYVPRPAAGTTSGPNTFQLFNQESSTTNRKGIAIGLTQGAFNLAAEDVFYFVEARDKTFSSLESGLPSSGVLIYFVNERIPQGQGPVIMLDKNPGTPTLSDAAFGVGDSRTIPGTGITIEVLAGTGGAPFDIRLTYTPPVDDYNVSITKGDTIDGEFFAWFSPDIWVDSPKNGLGNLSSGPPPNDQIENPVIGEPNRIYARINNAGPGTAFDFDVRFRVSEPHHTVGGESDFDQLVAIKHITSLAPGTNIIFADWTPTNDGDPHSCVYVDLINLVGTDTNQFDNGAQENLQEVTSVTGSPFHPVSYPFELTNPYTQPALFYFRAAGVPSDWSVVITPKKAMLNPGERVQVTAVITPPPDAQVCTSRRIEFTSWTPRGDTIIPVGGAVANILLRKPTLLTIDSGSTLCNREDLRLLAPGGGKKFSARKNEDPGCFCRRLVMRGCTIPALANQEIIVKFIDQDGKAVYHTVMTDSNGCYEDFLVTDSGTTWQATVEYEGDKCQGAVGESKPRPFWRCKPLEEKKRK